MEYILLRLTDGSEVIGMYYKETETNYSVKVSYPMSLKSAGVNEYGQNQFEIEPYSLYTNKVEYYKTNIIGRSSNSNIMPGVVEMYKSFLLSMVVKKPKQDQEEIEEKAITDESKYQKIFDEFIMDSNTAIN